MLIYTFLCVFKASEDFFDNLTVEQEFMSGIDTDKVGENTGAIFILLVVSLGTVVDLLP